MIMLYRCNNHHKLYECLTVLMCYDMKKKHNLAIVQIFTVTMKYLNDFEVKFV